MSQNRFVLNGNEVVVDVPQDTPLLWVLREELSLTGTKFGCGRGLCGSCTVHLNGQAIRSCITPLAAVQGQSITTIEGRSQASPLHPVQRAWIKHNVPQCGYCQSGQIMQAISVLENIEQKGHAEEILNGMNQNLCRCGTYHKIRIAVLEAAQEMGKI